MKTDTDVGSAAQQYPNACIGHFFVNSIIPIAPIVACTTIFYLQRIIHHTYVLDNCSLDFNAEKAGFEMTIILDARERN